MTPSYKGLSYQLYMLKLLKHFFRDLKKWELDINGKQDANIVCLVFTVFFWHHLTLKSRVRFHVGQPGYGGSFSKAHPPFILLWNPINARFSRFCRLITSHTRFVPCPDTFSPVFSAVGVTQTNDYWYKNKSAYHRQIPCIPPKRVCRVLQASVRRWFCSLLQNGDTVDTEVSICLDAVPHLGPFSHIRGIVFI